MWLFGLNNRRGHRRAIVGRGGFSCCQVAWGGLDGFGTGPLVGLAELRAHPALADMRVLQRGNRLSITPVAAREWTAILTGCLGISTTKG